MLYKTNKIQQFATVGNVEDIKFANKAVAYALENPDRGLDFKSGLIDWNDLALVMCSDASNTGETAVGITPSGKAKKEEFRSQGGRLHGLMNASDMNKDKFPCHAIQCVSKVIPRVCRSTVQAEAYEITYGVEAGDFIRAAIADIFGCLDIKRWEATAAQFMPQLWFTDCQSVYDTVRASVQAKAADKRLGIELAGLRQNLWRAKGEAIGNPLIRDELPVDATDSIRWIDTEVMLADPMTKNMEADKLIEFLSTNWWDTRQPIESVLKKQAKQIARRKAMATEERIDHNCTRYREPKEIDMSVVVRRVTKDLATGAVIDDDHKVTSRDTKYLNREMPLAPRNVRTIFYYPKEGADGTLVQPSVQPCIDEIGYSPPTKQGESYPQDYG